MPDALTARARWAALVVVCFAQFMVVLDATIVNVALPSIQTDLDLSTEQLQWIVNSYTLVFGGFLLLGGRAADLIGRRRLFLIGIAVFSAASLANALAELRRGADHRARRPGPRRGARLPRRAVDRHHDVRRGQGPHAGDGRLGRHRRRRRRLRPADGRHPHRRPQLAVDLPGQRPHRRRHRDRRAALGARVARPDAPPALRPRRRGDRHLGPDRPRLRDRQGAGARAGARCTRSA